MTFRFSLLTPMLGAVLLGGALPAEAGSSGSVSFSREILPILSGKCFICHGPDPREKDLLRLDSIEGATRDLGGYRALDPAAPEKSEILVRIHSLDDPMPPKDAEKQLTAKERALLDQWVRQGGEYEQHWAFVPPRKVLPDESGDSLKNPIDLHVNQILRQRGITLAPEADRRILARRAALVLTGLPPDPEPLAAFVADEGADAYERFVDGLLASPRYGEHQARYWLDAVRYGDTHGLHLDNRRGIYPYRDWVVQALNDNLPLDDFITWQLAGDLLPDPSLAQRVATGFVRMNPTTSEGGALPEEFQAKNNFDRTEMLGTVMLGMTLTCARCHTHKYDPITQTEYYRLLAFFNNTAESSMDGNAYRYAPVIKAPEDHAAWNLWNTLEEERDELLARAAAEIELRLPAVLAHAEARRGWSSGDWRISKATAATGAAPAEKEWGEARDLPGVRGGTLPGGDKAVWVSFRVDVPIDQALWLTFSGGPGSEVWVDEVSIPADVEGVPERWGTSIELPFSKGSHQVLVKMAGTKSATAIEARLENPWQAVAETGSWAGAGRDDRLRMLADPRGPLGHLALEKQARVLLHRMIEATGPFTTTLVAEDLAQPRQTRLLARGEYNLPTGEPLEPGVLAVMGAFPEGAPRNRLGLAQWLTSREHPLVSRVLINRIWQRTFGEGLVRTPEDFGLQGAQPTHPALLDWLAVELQESGWNMKHMLRLMVTSRTFRQSSARRSGIDDPENRLLARGPAHRLDAEELRDLALWASGMLDPHMGGEGVKPYQPSGIWLAMAHPASNTKRYVADKGPLLYRRSLYVYWKRTSPHPMMTLFDAPSRESSCVRRSRTNTSLQSLGLLNETQRLEMSRMLAERLLREAKNDADRLNLLFTLLASREPTDAERAACEKLLKAMRDRYAGSEEDALALLSSGDAERDESLNPSEHAAWSQVAITAMASDVAILLY